MQNSSMQHARAFWIVFVFCSTALSDTTAFFFGHKPNVCPEQVKVTMACYKDCGWIPDCVKAGRHPNPNDCGRYADCIPSEQDGHFTVREGDCFGFPFSPTLLQCVSQEECPECDTQVPRGGGVRLTMLDYLCYENNTNVCQNCQQSVTCIGSEAYGESCNMASFCSQHEAFGGSVCLPYQLSRNITSECQCEADKAIDSYNSTFYLTCHQEGNDTLLEVHRCPSGSEFDETVKMCNSSNSFCDDKPAVPICAHEKGTFVNPNDCSWSYTCSGDGSSTPENTTCCGSSTMYFSDLEQQCVPACQVLHPPPYLCTGFGNIADPLDCRKYYVCTSVGEDPVNHLTCPASTHFDEITHACVNGACPPSHDYMTCPRAAENEGTC